MNHKKYRKAAIEYLKLENDKCSLKKVIKQEVTITLYKKQNRYV